MKTSRPTKRQIARARKYVREHTSEILLHALMLRWGLRLREVRHGR
jgi:hypothetical protein